MKQGHHYYVAATLSLIFLCVITVYLSRPISLKEELQGYHYATFFCEHSRILNNTYSFAKRDGKERIKYNRIMMEEEGYSLYEIDTMEQDAKYTAIQEWIKKKCSGAKS